MKNNAAVNCVERTNCRLCGSRDIPVVFELVATPPGDHYLAPSALASEYEPFPLALCLCSACGNLQLSHVVNPSILYSNYIYTTSISLGLDRHFSDYVADLDKFIGGLKDRFVVDFGSNDGTCLRFVKEREARIRGIEPATGIARAANDAGIPTTEGFFNPETAERIVSTEGQCDCLLANNVLANIDDLDAVFRAVQIVLKQNGIFVFETGYAASLVQSHIIDNITHEHLEYFAVRPLVTFLRRYGLEVVRVVHTDSKGGSIRVFAVLGKNACIDRSVEESIQSEEKAGLFAAESYVNLTRAMQGAYDALHHIVKEEKKLGRQLVGYGASVGVTTLLYFFKLGKEIEFLVDDNKSRFGLLSPGFHREVCPPSRLLEKPQRSVIVFAWRYVEPIASSNKLYLENGGRFIVPLPAPHFFKH